MSDPNTPHNSLAAPVRAGLFSRRHLWPWLALVPVLVAAVVALRVEGRLWWCACGRPAPWAGSVNSPHNSQHLFDPYTFTHVAHGLLLYGLLAWCCPRLALPWRFWITTTVETLWEVIENTNVVIERFRTATLALDYHGDTVVNVLGDVLSCGAGFALARWLGFRGSLALLVLMELVLLVWIRDNLFLSALMLIYPIEALKTWQTGA